MSATIDETINTDKEIFMSKEIEKVTPNKAAWERVSPKKDNRLQITKQPKGPVTSAIPTPAIKALIKKSSIIKGYNFFFNSTPSEEWAWSWRCS